MAYIGKEPIVGNFQKCDAITVVNGQAAYTLQVSSTNVVPESANHMLVSLNGILQAPVTSFTVSGSTLTFASNLATGDVIDFVILLGNVLDIGTPSDGTVTNAKLASALQVGKQTIWVPANAMTPTASNGCAAVATVETTSGRPDLYVLDFDDGSDEHAQFTVAFPKSWNLGTITFQVFWTSTATDTDGVSWALQGVGMADNETLDVAYGTAVVVDDACQSAAEELYVTAESSAVTIAGTPADDDLTYFRIFRDVSDANDTAAEDARLIGVKIFYTTDAANDA